MALRAPRHWHSAWEYEIILIQQLCAALCKTTPAYRGAYSSSQLTIVTYLVTSNSRNDYLQSLQHSHGCYPWKSLWWCHTLPHRAESSSCRLSDSCLTPQSYDESHHPILRARELPCHVYKGPVWKSFTVMFVIRNKTTDLLTSNMGASKSMNWLASTSRISLYFWTLVVMYLWPGLATRNVVAAAAAFSISPSCKSSHIQHSQDKLVIRCRRIKLPNLVIAELHIIIRFSLDNSLGEKIFSHHSRFAPLYTRYLF